MDKTSHLLAPKQVFKDPFVGKLCCNLTCLNDTCTKENVDECKQKIPCDKCSMRKRCLKEFKNYDVDKQRNLQMSKEQKQNNTYSALEYESLRDECMEMAYILNKIENETHNCAMCKGDHVGGYSTDLYLKTICEILYSSQRNHLKYKKK